MHKILITGATGYLGSSLTSYLFKECGFDVSVLVRDRERYPNNFGLPDENIFEVEKLRLYSKNEVSFQSIIHCATRYKADRVTELIAANVSYPLEVIDTVLDKDGFFFNVDTSLKPDTNLYAFSKNQFEIILKEIADNGGPKIINLELEYFFDENEPLSRFLPSLIEACKKNEDFDLTEGDQIRDFIHIIDLCTAIETLIKDRNRFEDYFINVGVGSGNGISIKDRFRSWRYQTCLWSHKLCNDN